MCLLFWYICAYISHTYVSHKYICISEKWGRNGWERTPELRQYRAEKGCHVFTFPITFSFCLLQYTAGSSQLKRILGDYFPHEIEKSNWYWKLSVLPGTDRNWLSAWRPHWAMKLGIFGFGFEIGSLLHRPGWRWTHEVPSSTSQARVMSVCHHTQHTLGQGETIFAVYWNLWGSRVSAIGAILTFQKHLKEQLFPAE